MLLKKSGGRKFLEIEKGGGKISERGLYCECGEGRSRVLSGGDVVRREE